jgi:hypothetical protein
LSTILTAAWLNFVLKDDQGEKVAEMAPEVNKHILIMGFTITSC